MNLLENACRYASSASRRVIELAAVVVGRDVSICVRDYGPGISRAHAAALFRPFVRPAGSAAGAAGVGLGLALSRRLARSLGGELAIDHRVSDGACFELRLPRS